MTGERQQNSLDVIISFLVSEIKPRPLLQESSLIGFQASGGQQTPPTQQQLLCGRHLISNIYLQLVKSFTQIYLKLSCVLGADGEFWSSRRWFVRQKQRANSPWSLMSPFDWSEVEEPPEKFSRSTVSPPCCSLTPPAGVSGLSGQTGLFLFD